MNSLNKLVAELAQNIDKTRLNESNMLRFVDDSQLAPIEPTEESEWARFEDESKEYISRNYKFKNFKTLMYFIAEGLKYQEKIQHHAKMVVEEKTIKIILHTHDLNQITQQDLKLSKYFDELYEDTQYFYSVEF